MLIVADTIEAYLEDHYKKLKEKHYYNLRGELELFPANPLSLGANGSSCITKGIKVEAVAKFFHYFSKFN